MIIIDIETVPSPEYLENPPDWFKESRYFPRPKLGNLVDPAKIAAKTADWEAKGGMIKDLSTCIFTAKPIVICDNVYGSETNLTQSVLRNWASLINRHLPLVTFNGKGYDIPLIVAWCAKNGWSQEAQVWGQLNTSKYERVIHIDLYNMFPDCPDLETLGYFLGCKTEKYGDGNDVYQWYIAGAMDKIIKHCQQDVALTTECAERLGAV